MSGLSVFESLERIGDSAGILDAAQAAEAAGNLTGWQALAAGRAGLRSGRYRDAERWLATARAANEPGAAWLATLEQAHWAIAARLDLQAAQRVLSGDDAPRENLPPDVQAEAQWVRSRLVAALAIYREASPEAAEQALAACLAAADRLEQLGLPRRALAARLHVAERQDAGKIDALQEVARRAEAVGQFDFVARCHAASLQACLAEDRAAEAEPFLVAAEAAWLRSGEVFGALEARALRETFNVTARASPFEPLEACASEFAERQHFSGAMSALLTLADISLRRGDSVRSGRYRDWLLRVAEQAGTTSMAVNDLLAKIDSATRAGLYRDAISYADEVLRRAPPAAIQAGALIQRSVAMARQGRPDAALKDLAAAQALYDRLHGEEDVSDTIPHYVAMLAEAADGAGDEAAYQETDRLLTDWQARDLRRHDPVRAAEKVIARIDLRASHNLARQKAGQDPGKLLAEMAALIDEAGTVLGSAAGAKVTALRATLGQREGQIASFRNDSDAAIEAYARAAKLYGSIGYDFQQANCHYILGCLFYNRFNDAPRELVADAFSRAERSLQSAQRYYREKGGLQVQAAQSAEKLVRLYIGASRYFPDASRPAILGAAEDLVRDALASLDDIRRAYFSQDRLEALRGKAVHVAESDALYAHASRLAFLLAPDARKALHFVSHQKSRILADLMGADLAVPAALQAALADDPHLAALLREERAAFAGFAEASGDGIAALRARLADLYQRMSERQAARAYIEVRRGEAPDADDVPAILNVPDAAAMFIDWADVAGQVWLLAANRSGEVAAAPTGMAMPAVQAFRETFLATLSFRNTLQKTPELLDQLAPLVAPLASLTAPGDHLVLCPTGPIGAIPLHALPLAGETVLERNPVFYAPSLGILRTCRLFETPDAPRRAALFGVLDDAHAGSRGMLDRLSQQIGTPAVIGPEVTEQGVLDALAHATLVHFQGHGRHDSADPLQSHLVLPGAARLTAERIFNLPVVATRLVVLGACEGAISRVAAGDELLGLIPAFLAAGVGAVVAAGWRVNEPTASRFMEVFYDRMRHAGRPIEAVQAASLALKGDARTCSPYHWAAFIGYGNPWGRAVPCPTTS